MLRLNIEQQPARLELSITNPSLTMHSQAPRLEIETEAAVVEIRQPRGRLEIDQYPCRASYGLKNLEDRIREWAEAGRQTALETIAKIAQDGDRMARIYTKEDVIVNLAKESTVAEQLEVGIVPIAPPIIRYQVNPPEYWVTPAESNMQYYPGTVDLQLNRGRVDAAMAQYQSIRFWTTGTRDFSA